MGSIKVIGIVSIVVFLFIIFVVNDQLRTEIISVFNIKLGKLNIRIKNIFVILIIFIIFFVSVKKYLYVKNLMDFLVQRELNKTESMEESYEKK